MRYRLSILALFLIAPLAAQEKARDLEPKIVKLVEECTPKTVCVRAQLVGRLAVLGSGSLISDDGYVLTCAHVVEAVATLGGTGLNVMLPDGRSFPATLLGTHKKRDFAIMKIEAQGLPFYELGDSDALKKGSWVLALGHPMGIIGTKATGNDVPAVTAGVVTGLGRKMLANSGGLEFKMYPNAIETDLPLFFGNSGGPLVDFDGKLVGVNAAIQTGGEPKSFSIPIKTVRKYLDTLKGGDDAKDAEPEGRWDRLVRFFNYLQEVGQQSQEPIVDPRLEHLKGEFTEAAEKASPSIVSVRIGEDRVAYGVVVDGKGTVATPHHALTRKAIGTFLWGKLRDSIPNDSPLRRLLDPILPQEKRGAIRVETSDGGSYPAKERKTAEGLDITFLDVEWGDDAPPAKMEPQAEAPARGAWVISVTGEHAPEGVGILSTRGKRIEAVTPIPTTLNDLMDLVKQDMSLFEPRNFEHIYFHDAFVSNRGVGGPLLDGQGRWIGLNVFTLSRGASYAVPVKDILDALHEK